jgi:hypothetical protein
VSADVQIDDSDLRRAMDRFASGAESAVRDATRREAAAVASRTRGMVPRRTGRLAASVSSSGDSVEVGAPYARYVAWPAVNRAIVDADRRLADQLERDIETLGRRL